MEKADFEENLRPNRDYGHFYAAILTHLAPIMLFVVLPLLLAVSLGYHTINMEKEKHLELLRADLDTGLTQIHCDVDAENFLKKVARGSYQTFKSKSADSAAFLQYYESLQRFLPVEFDLYAFNAKGQLVTPNNVTLRSRYLAGRLWEILNCSPTEQNKRLQKIKRPLRSFLGDEFRMSLFLEGRDSCLPIIVRHNNGYVYWYNDPNQPQLGILMIFWEAPDLDFRIGEITRRFSKNCIAGFFTDSPKSINDFGKQSVSLPQAGEIFRKGAWLGESFIFDGQDRLWASRQVGALWIFTAMQARLREFNRLQLALVICILLLGLMAVAVYVWSSRRKFWYISIRLKLIVLFLAAVASPIMGFSYLGYRYLDDRRQNLHAEVANQSRKLLFTLDESFKEIGQNLLRNFYDLSRRAANPDDQKFAEDVLTSIEANELISIELRNPDNAQINYFTQNEMFFEGMREVSDAFSRFCIDQALGSSLSDAVDPILEMVVQSPEAGMSFFFSRPGEVHKMEFGPVPLFIFWDIFKNALGQQFYVYIVQSANRLLHHFASTSLRQMFRQQSNRPFILAANHRQTQEWLPYRINASQQLTNFSNRVFFSDQPIDMVLNIKGADYIITGQKGKNAKDYAFYAFYPLINITTDIARQRRLILAAILLFLIIALLTGWLLSDTFLAPVARLGEGVAAIKSRNHTFRIEASQKDEFGDLAVSFNHMIADLKEMQLAKDVQESLLPSSPPVIPGYDVAFTNRMASAVGGDYFDVHVIDKERICVIVGDVTGHGVSSALVMAMARAIFYQGLKEGDDLLGLFQDLNYAIYEYFRVPPVRKMMTVFATVINLADGSGEFVNAGHNFPVKLSLAGGCEDLADIHLPIGACKKLRKMKPQKFSLAIGDTVIFYTDGLIEVANFQKEMYGYERFKLALTQNAGNSAQTIINELLRLYEDWMGNAEPDDDLTIIALKRL